MLRTFRSEAIVQRLGELDRQVVIAVGMVAVVAVGVADLVTGDDVSVVLFYVGIVLVAAGSAGWRVAVGMGSLAVVVWMTADIADEPGGLSASTIAWNTFARGMLLIVVVGLVGALRDEVARVGELSRTDALTGVANARMFREAAAAELSRMGRTNDPLTVAYADVDDFKRINDRAGHVVGDEVLRQMASGLAAALRETDFVARLGGDEFAILLPDTDGDQAAVVLSDLEARLAAHDHDLGWPVTFSIGAITFSAPPSGVDELLRRADEQMYEAKRSGKARVSLASDSRPASAPSG